MYYNVLHSDPYICMKTKEKHKNKKERKEN